MDATNVVTSTGPPIQRRTTAVARQLRTMAEKILESKKNANLLCNLLEMFNRNQNNYTPLLLTVELVFNTFLRRGDMFEEVETTKSAGQSPEAIHAKWLRSIYDIALTRTVACMKRGEESSRIQALVTCCKLAIQEGLHPLEDAKGIVCFPQTRLKNIFEVLLDRQEPQTALINRFEEYTEYRDIQEYGLKLLSMLAYDKCPSQTFIQNYLELFDVLMKQGLPIQPPRKRAKYVCEKNGETAVDFNPVLCQRYVNRCWGFCLKWPLRATEAVHRRALVVLVDRIMPYLHKPALATDLLCDSLDCGHTISMLALRGMFELVTKHKIVYPDIYDRLYGMFEPEMFATRSKNRLLHLADVFLSSTRLPQNLVAAFAKRLSRLALVAPPEDTRALLQLISNLLQRHPGLARKMIPYDDQIPIMPKDPYVMEEASAKASRAIHSSLWELSALQDHFKPEISVTARRMLAAAEGTARPPELVSKTTPELEQFDIEVKKRFKTIEMNFVRANSKVYRCKEERLDEFWNMPLA